MSAAQRKARICGAVCGFFVLAGCSDYRGAKDAAEAQGLTDVRPDGYSWFGCSDEDLYHTSFTARGVNGRRVEGVVCAGFLKGSTVRITRTEDR